MITVFLMETYSAGQMTLWSVWTLAVSRLLSDDQDRAGSSP